MAVIANLLVEEHGRYYEVSVVETSSGEIMDEYRAGNSAWESQVYLEPHRPAALGFDQMVDLGKVTLSEMARQYDASPCEDIEVVNQEGDHVKSI